MTRVEYPYIAMISQRYSRTYIDCQELGATTPCCPDCIQGHQSMLDAPTQRKIFKHPPTADGSNSDWAMNIEATVCCAHVHLAVITRSEWWKLVEKYKATPFYIDQKETRYELDDDGNPTLLHSRNKHVSSPVSRRAVAERKSVSPVSKGPFNRTIRCQFCSTVHAIFGQCPKCFPSDTQVEG